MRTTKNVPRILSLLLTLVILVLAIVMITPSNLITQSSPTLTVTAATDKHTYLLREKAAVEGSITLGGSPAYDLVVAVQVNNPPIYGTPGTPHSFRTLQIGNPTQPWLVNITSIYLQDLNSNPIDTIQAGSRMRVGMNVHNLQMGTLEIFCTTTVYDANMVSLGTNTWTSSVDPILTVGSTFTVEIPRWACSGPALIVGCVYSNEPRSGGIVYCPERAFYYCISRTQSGLFGIQQLSPPPPQTAPGVYNSSVRLPPDPRSGDYSVYVLGQSSPSVRSSATTSFNVQDSTGYPPQASFVYWPTSPTVNHNVDFDASTSTAEGYNDIIKRYEWSFGDGTPNVIKTGSPPDPTTTHNFTQAISYVVTLNVTDNEGLWCTTSKPVTIGLGYGPTANFTWIPHTAVLNESIAFDASNSTPGDYSTLVNYSWNFSDGTGTINFSTPQTTHSFSNPGNYTVTLTVLDSVGRSGSTEATVEVMNKTVKIYDVNRDGKIGGLDITLVAWSFGAAGPGYYYPGSPPDARWNPNADVNGDNRIGGLDLTLVAHHFGEDP